ncbi:MAG: YlbF family regulator [Halodesulfurarchaeum sp.]|nr:YlbF family regulator [Halodesulfurarchaeum sp.]
MSEQQTPDIDTRLRTFVEAIKDSDRYRTFLDAREDLDEDENAQDLLRQYQQKQVLLERGGRDPEVLSELRDVRREMADNETITRYRRAESELIEMLEQTNDAISERIGEEFARSTGGCCS